MPISGDPVVRIAARGDGVTRGGKHVPFAAPGDVLRSDGTVEAGPHRQVPPCRHFPECGGCQLQHVDDAAYRDYLTSRVSGALTQHALEAPIRDPHLSPPNSRRRASLRAMASGGGVALGFNAARSHRIVDMRENHILRPELIALLEPLRRLLRPMLKPRRVAEVRMTLADQGVDLGLAGVEPDGLAQIEAVTGFCEAHGLARLTIDGGLGPETRFEAEPATITLSGVAVALPVGAFLQATADGECALVEAVREAVGDAGTSADLFAGIGTFALALPGQVHAAEASRDAAAALLATRRVKVEHRDLYRRPLDAGELARFDAIVLDPPRAGAEEQVRQVAASRVARVAYVSCNPATFARDARMLVDAGFRLEWVRPVGQFRWSTHVELASAFSR